MLLGVALVKVRMQLDLIDPQFEAIEIHKPCGFGQLEDGFDFGTGHSNSFVSMSYSPGSLPAVELHVVQT